MSDNQRKRLKGGGGKLKAAEAGHKAKSLQERSLNAWRDLRPALEVGAAEKQYITSMELILDEKISLDKKVHHFFDIF